MIIDEAIKHCEEVAEVQEENCKHAGHDHYTKLEASACAAEHRQLAEWLRKYQKIENIVDDYDLEAWEVLEMIKEVVRA
jgi:uncharacterized protein YpbB